MAWDGWEGFRHPRQVYRVQILDPNTAGGPRPIFCTKLKNKCHSEGIKAPTLMPIKPAPKCTRMG